MLFTETQLKGAYQIDLELRTDERGFFARSWCRREFETWGLNQNLAECSISYNRKRGTLRGMHYQVAPHEEAKLVRCTRGAIYDVIIDLRPSSRTFKRWIGVELTEHNRRMVYVPEGFAHGFLTLQDDTEIFYQISERYSVDHARGVRWNDPAFAIQWPEKVVVVSEKDRRYSDFGL